MFVFSNQARLLVTLSTLCAMSGLDARPWPKRHQIDTYSITLFAVDQEDESQICAHKTFEAPTYRQVSDKVERFLTALCTDKENVSITLTCKVKTIDDTWIERKSSRSILWCKNDSENPLSDRHYTIKTRKVQKNVKRLIKEMCTTRTLFDLGPVFTTFALIISLPILALTAGILFFTTIFAGIALTPVLVPVVYVGIPAFVVYEVSTSSFVYEYFYEPLWQPRTSMVLVC